MITASNRQAAWRRAKPQAYAAHLAVKAALRSGELQRGACEVCGATQADGVRIDAHHDDYSRPLAVRWLCRQHHAREHRVAAADLFARRAA